MKKYYKYPRYINLIGIEFEGAYKRNIIELLERDRLLTVTSDGSVNINSLESDIYAPYEVLTKPLKGKELANVIKQFSIMEKNEDYIINNTCGLHFHISLKKCYQAYVQRIEFYNDMYNFFKIKYPRIFTERSNNQYCRAELRGEYIKSQFNRSSEDRYHLVNYSLEGEACIPTIEIRFYGGSYSSVKGLYKIIQQTIKIIGKHIKIDRTIADHKAEIEDVCRILPTVISPIKRTEQYKTVKINPLKFASKKVRSKTEYIFKSGNNIKEIDYRIRAVKQLEPIIINFSTI